MSFFYLAVKMNNIIKTLFTNKIIIYLLSRYGTYGLQFLVSLSIAAKLGPYYLGIYGFINLIISYFGQLNFGIPHSLNVLLVHNKSDERICNNYIGNSVFIYGVLSLIVVILYLFVQLCNYNIDDKYIINEYYFPICILAILTYFNALFTTVLRVRNKVNQLSIIQSINVVLNLIVVFFFYERTLIMALLLCQLISAIVCFYITQKEKVVPNLLRLDYSFKIQKKIIKKGVFLFLYNSCFYFILISIRSIISSNYSVSDFGIFNFSFSIANAVLLLLESLGTIIFPKIIELLSSKDYNKIRTTLFNLRISFISTAHLLIYFAMIFFPLVIKLLPQYSNALTSMNLIGLAILINTNSYGFSTLLIAQNKEKISAIISAISLIINVVVGLFLVNVIEVQFEYAILSVMITYLCFSAMIVYSGSKLIGVNSLKDIILNIFPLRLLIPYVTALIISIYKLEFMIFFPLLLFILFNWNDIIAIKNMSVRLFKNPNIADV